MTLPEQSVYAPPVTLITPECGIPSCDIAGDQYTMVRCRSCGGWFCPEHIDAQEGVTLVRLAPRSLASLAYYQGICVPCRQTRQQTHH